MVDIVNAGLVLVGGDVGITSAGNAVRKTPLHERNLLPTMMSMRGRREGIKAFVRPPTLGGGMAACSGTLVYPPVSMVVNIAFGFCSQSAPPTTCRDKTLTVPEPGHLGFALDFVPRSYIPKVSINIISIRLSGGEFNEYMETNV